MRESTAQFFAMAGHNSVQAGDGHDAISMAETHAPDVILMDIQMPGMNGVQAARVLHARRTEALIFAWTAMPDAIEGSTSANAMRAPRITSQPMVMWA